MGRLIKLARAPCKGRRPARAASSRAALLAALYGPESTPVPRNRSEDFQTVVFESEMMTVGLLRWCHCRGPSRSWVTGAYCEGGGWMFPTY